MTKHQIFSKYYNSKLNNKDFRKHFKTSRIFNKNVVEQLYTNVNKL